MVDVGRESWIDRRRVATVRQPFCATRSSGDVERAAAADRPEAAQLLSTDKSTPTYRAAILRDVLRLAEALSKTASSIIALPEKQRIPSSRLHNGVVASYARQSCSCS